MQAEYSMGAVLGEGETVLTDKLLTARFNIDHHGIKIGGQVVEQAIQLPPILFDLELHDETNLTGNIDIQHFEEELTTDLFNLLMFLQEELRQELNDILSKLRHDERSLFSQEQGDNFLFFIKTLCLFSFFQFKSDLTLKETF